LAVATLACGGCSAPQADVTGVVTFEGRPLAIGGVMAVGVDGVPHYGAIGKDGRYALGGLPVGGAVWAVTSPDPDAPVVERPRDSDPPPPPAAHGEWFPIPDRYSATSLSGLENELVAGANTFDIRLTK
jgi:hypothetical protein